MPSGLLLSAMFAAMSRRRAPRVVTIAEVNHDHEAAKREDWNRTVEARKAAKRQAKQTNINAP